MARLRTLIARATLGVLMLLASAVPGARAADITPAAAVASLKAAAAYIVSAQLPDGSFHYEYDFKNASYSDSNNLVRQAGAGSVLSQYLALTGDKAFIAPIKAAIGYYGAQSTPRQAVGGKAAAVGGNAGATALALLTELVYSQTTADDSFATNRLAWLRGLASLQTKAGGFVRSVSDARESSFYNGEAWLALAQYHQRFPSDDLATRLLLYAEQHFIAHYDRKPDLQFAHWGLMAAALRYQATGQPRFLHFITRLAAAHVRQLRPVPDADENSCAAVEGLASAAGALLAGKADEALVATIVADIEASLGNDLGLQIAAGQTSLTLADGTALASPDIANFAGAFRNARSSTKTRIDSTQHCLSALMQLATLGRS